MDYAEMLFAAEVRRLSREMLLEHREFVMSSVEDKDKPKAMAEFRRTNPQAEYVVQALALIKDTAKQIKEIDERGTGESFWENKP